MPGRGPQRIAAATITGTVLAPSRLSEFTRQNGAKVREFETDVVQSDQYGTSTVTVKSDAPLYERVDSPERVTYNVVFRQWPSGDSFAELVSVAGNGQKAPAAR